MHIDIDQKLLRTGDPLEISGDPTPLTQETGWKNKFNFEETILKILNSKFSNFFSQYLHNFFAL